MSSGTRLTYTMVSGQFRCEGERALDLAGMLGADGVRYMADKVAPECGWQVERSGSRVLMTKEFQGASLAQYGLAGVQAVRVRMEGGDGLAGLTVKHRLDFGTNVMVEEGQDGKDTLQGRASAEVAQRRAAVDRLVAQEGNVLLRRSVAAKLEERLKQQKHLCGVSRVRTKVRQRDAEVVRGFCEQGYMRQAAQWR